MMTWKEQRLVPIMETDHVLEGYDNPCETCEHWGYRCESCDAFVPVTCDFEVKEVTMRQMLICGIPIGRPWEGSRKMNCPNCNKKMKDKSYWYYGIGDWDMDCPATYHEEHWCPDCRIKYMNSKWIIPKKYERATVKQVKCANFICRELGLSYEPILKSKTWKFINTYLEAAKQSNRASFESWCDDNYDWVPEYF